MLLTFSGERPGRLLSTLQCMGSPTPTATKSIWFNMTIVQKLGNLGLEASRWLSWNRGGEWVLAPPGLMQERAERRSCGWETARKHTVSAGWEWDGVQWSEEYLQKRLSFLNNVSGRDTNICYFQGGVNFVPVCFLKGPVVKTCLAYLCSLFTLKPEGENKIYFLFLVSSTMRKFFPWHHCFLELSSGFLFLLMASE